MPKVGVANFLAVKGFANLNSKLDIDKSLHSPVTLDFREVRVNHEVKLVLIHLTSTSRLFALGLGDGRIMKGERDRQGVFVSVLGSTNHVGIPTPRSSGPQWRAVGKDRGVL